MRDAKSTEFKLTPPDQTKRREVFPLEPLYSMLADAPLSVLNAMLCDLNDFTHESQLEDRYESIGVTRRVLLEQAKRLHR